MRCTGVILAGGEASRYEGRAKGLELVGGRRIVDRVAASLATACDEILVVANAADASAWLPGMRVERDIIAGKGSLGGLYSALAHAESAIIAVAWDMPFIPPALLIQLRRVGEQGEDDAVFPESSTAGAIEPMCAWYAPSSLSIIRQRLDEGILKLTSLTESLRARRLAYADVISIGDPRVLFMNVNSPSDLSRAERYARSMMEPDVKG